MSELDQEVRDSRKAIQNCLLDTGLIEQNSDVYIEQDLRADDTFIVNISEPIMSSEVIETLLDGFGYVFESGQYWVELSEINCEGALEKLVFDVMSE
jgi:hypothetical protein